MARRVTIALAELLSQDGIDPASLVAAPCRRPYNCKPTRKRKASKGCRGGDLAPGVDRKTLVTLYLNFWQMGDTGGLPRWSIESHSKTVMLGSKNAHHMSRRDSTASNSSFYSDVEMAQDEVRSTP